MLPDSRGRVFHEKDEYRIPCTECSADFILMMLEKFHGVRFLCGAAGPRSRQSLILASTARFVYLERSAS